MAALLQGDARRSQQDFHSNELKERQEERGRSMLRQRKCAKRQIWRKQRQSQEEMGG